MNRRDFLKWTGTCPGGAGVVEYLTSVGTDDGDALLVTVLDDAEAESVNQVVADLKSLTRRAVHVITLKPGQEIRRIENGATPYFLSVHMLNAAIKWKVMCGGVRLSAVWACRKTNLAAVYEGLTVVVRHFPQGLTFEPTTSSPRPLTDEEIGETIIQRICGPDPLSEVEVVSGTETESELHTITIWQAQAAAKLGRLVRRLTSSDTRAAHAAYEDVLESNQVAQV